MLDAEAVIANPNLMKWMPPLDSGDFLTYLSWLMCEGDSVWIPCGSFPIFIGQSEDQKWEKEVKIKEDPTSGAIQRHTFALGISPVFDPVYCHSAAGVETCNFVASQFVRSSQWLPTSWKEHAQVTAWKEKMEASVAGNAGAQSAEVI